MATVRQVITAAYRKLGVVTEGEPAPTAYNAEVALYALQSTYLEWISRGLFGRLEEIEATENTTAEEWQRIRANGYTITIPTTIEDEESGEDRAPRDLALIVIAKASPEYHLFEAPTGAWVRLDSLTLDSYAPVSNRGADGLACYLACKLYEEGHGQQPGQITAFQARRFHGALSVKYDGAATVTPAAFY